MSNLPPAPQLARECAGRTYAEVGHRYGVSREAVRCHLKRHGLLKPRRTGRYHPIKISTAIALIAQGVTTYRDLSNVLGYKSISSPFYLVEELIRRGLVEKTEHNQLRLTIAGEQYHPVPITIVRQRPDGAFEPVTI